MQIILAGGTGYIGRKLSAFLKLSGHNVQIITRTPKSANDLNWNSIKKNGFPNGTDIVVNLCGRNIGELNPSFFIKRNYDSYIDELFSSRIDTTKLLVEASKSSPIKSFINASAIGFYRTDLKNDFTESEPYVHQGLITDLVKKWEDAAQIPSRPDISQFQLRIGVVLGKNSNFITSLYPSHRLGFGGPIGNGNQWISWIHINDLVRIIVHIMDSNSKVLNGPVNCTSPKPVRQSVMSKALCEALRAPQFPFGPVAVPEFVVKTLFGSDRSVLLLEGQRVIPKKLQESAFHFHYANLGDALEEICGKRPNQHTLEQI